MKTKASQLKPGDRVVCVRNVTDTHMYIFGRGVYVGPTQTANGPDVTIRLDDGQEMYGAESPVWLFEHDLNDPAVRDLKIEVVSIANDRAIKEQIHTICMRLAEGISGQVPGLKPENVAISRSHPHAATLIATFTFTRAMTLQEIAEIDSLLLNRNDNTRKPS